MDAVKTGRLIAQVRKEKELTQKNLAEKLHVSVQAVSKWERSLSCPDIGLLEPLAEALDLTVTELLSGQRGEQPGEEAVRDSLRFGENQLRPKIRRWKWLFITAAVLLLAVLAGLGYVWVRDNTEWLPQRETVVREMSTSSQENQIVSALGSTGFNLHMYQVTLADDVTCVTLQAELWSHQGMEQRWHLMEHNAGTMGFDSRRQLLVLNITPHSENWSEEEQRWTEMYFDCGISFAGSSVSGRLIDNITHPYISGGAGWGRRDEPQTVDREDGAILLTVSIGGPGSAIYTPGGLPPEHEDALYLVVRMYCK